MYELTGLFFYKVQFMAELLVAEYLFLLNIKRRNHFAWRIVIGILLSFSFAFAIPIVNYTSWYMIIMFFTMFAFTVGVQYFCFDTSLINIFFLTSAGYLVQHISYAINQLVLIVTKIDGDLAFKMYGSGAATFMNIFSFLIYSDCYVTTYLLIYVLFGRRISDSDFYITKVWVFILCAIFVFSAIILNSFVVNTFSVKENETFIVISLLYSIGSSLISLFFYFQLKDTKKVEHDRDMIRQLWKEDKEHYEIQKENIDIINSKCHDLKHQLRAIRQGKNLDPTYIKQIEKSVLIYDSVVKTGCDALDVVLTEKSFICQEKKINLTYMMDGEKLNFMNESDIYSIFGNAIDNAIEYLTSKVEEGKRFIRISSKEDKGMFLIHIENYFEDKLNLVDGLPETTKGDRSIHGFGLKSVRMICQEYGGELYVKNSGSLFVLNIFLPIKQEDTKM